VQGVMQVERRLGGFLLDKPKQMLFHFNAANLCVSIEDFSLGWRCKQNANYQVRLTLHMRGSEVPDSGKHFLQV